MAEEQIKTDTGEEQSLQDFTFDEPVDFFGIKEESLVENQKQTIKEVKKAETTSEEDDTPEATDLSDDKKGKAGKRGKAEEDEPEPKFFAEEEVKDEKKEELKEVKKKDEGEDGNSEEDIEVVEEKDKKEKVDDTKFFSTLAAEMKEKGVFQNIEIKEDEEITEEKFFELQDAEIEARVNETFEQFFSELDPDAKAFLKHKKNGGATADFINMLVDTDSGVPDFDAENKDHVEKVLINYLTKVEKLDAEELKDRLDFLEEGGKKKAYATKYHKQLEEARVAEEKAIEQASEKAAKKREENAQAFQTSLGETLDKLESVNSVPITKADQQGLVAYITKPTVKVGKGKYVPVLSVAIAKIFKGETPEDQQRLIALAKVVKDDFKLPDIEIKEKTKVVKKAQSKLAEAKNNPKVASTGGGSKRSLAEFFPDD